MLRYIQHRAYPSRDVWMEQILDLLIMDFKEHDTHSAACCALLSLDTFEQLPASHTDTEMFTGCSAGCPYCSNRHRRKRQPSAVYDA